MCLSEGLNSPIAVGSRLPLNIDLRFAGSSAPAFSLRSANPDLFNVVDGAVEAEGDGVAALLVNTEDGKSVLDFIHLFLKTPNALHLERVDSAQRSSFSDVVELFVGDSITLVAVLANGAQPLLGDIETEWQVDGDALAVLRTGILTQRELRARNPGETTLTVSAAGLTSTLTIRVLP